VIVYEDKTNPLLYVGVGVTEDERYAFLSVSKGTYGSELYYKDWPSRHGLRPSSRASTSTTRRSTTSGTSSRLHEHRRSNFKVILVDPKKPAKENWTTVIRRSRRSSPRPTRGEQAVRLLSQGREHEGHQHELDGALIRRSPAGARTASGFGGWKDDKILFYTFTSITYPPTIYKYDLATGASEVFRKAEVKFNPEDYEVKQVFFESKDKTKVPMFIVHKKGLALDGKAPCFLTAYGGFNISVQPSFSPSSIVLLENGCVFAEPNLRGGGEYGETWHKAGMLENKQNVFDDFIAAAEYLIREKYTSADKLPSPGLERRLLVGAAMTQRPELFKVALPRSASWTCSAITKSRSLGLGRRIRLERRSEAVQFLYAYSPLHNSRGVAYPATFVTTADHDDGSSRPFVQVHRHAPGEAPGSIPSSSASRRAPATARAISPRPIEATDAFSFFFHNVGLTPKYE